MLIAEVQDSLLVAMNDLQRLDGLLTHATDNLLMRFTAADGELSTGDGDPALRAARARSALTNAVTELQFHDMATQLIGHTARVLNGCADRLATQAMGREKDEPEDPAQITAPTRPNPVTQSEMDAGSIELF